MKCIEPEPEDRYETIGRVRLALDDTQATALLVKRRDEDTKRKQADEERGAA